MSMMNTLFYCLRNQSRVHPGTRNYARIKCEQRNNSKKTLLANEGLLFREFLAVHCSPKIEQSPCTFVAGVLPVQIW